MMSWLSQELCWSRYNRLTSFLLSNNSEVVLLYCIQFWNGTRSLVREKGLLFAKDHNDLNFLETVCHWSKSRLGVMPRCLNRPRFECKHNGVVQFSQGFSIYLQTVNFASCACKPTFKHVPGCWKLFDVTLFLHEVLKLETKRKCHHGVHKCCIWTSRSRQA